LECPKRPHGIQLGVYSCGLRWPPHVHCRDFISVPSPPVQPTDVRSSSRQQCTNERMSIVRVQSYWALLRLCFQPDGHTFSPSKNYSKERQTLAVASRQSFAILGYVLVLKRVGSTVTLLDCVGRGARAGVVDFKQHQTGCSALASAFLFVFSSSKPLELYVLGLKERLDLVIIHCPSTLWACVEQSRVI
jgi:hypothetical protein